jgi:hypothetical protein
VASIIDTEYEWPYLLAMASDGPQMFLRQRLDGDIYMTKFSVPSTSSALLKGRSVVTHTGLGPRTGVWHCSKDQSHISCPHITSTRTVLARLLPEEPDREDGEILVSESISAEKLCI